ncbi:toll/interleukin-1 receptor domain-containing protein [Salipiger abyssi]|uniref:toll/interleukin-1 receptor domain-containing protein n=1 Tax=Salipiger abyssi TaxID=1250539 RepID=UPI004057CF82
MSNRLWLTYAWRNNEDEDIDYLIQKLEDIGLEVKYDRATLLAGRPLWDQLDAQIDWANIDAWAIYVTKESLESEPCRQELSYALSIAHRQGRMNFPLIGILPESVAPELLPKAISTRLYVDLNDPSAIQQVADGVSGKKSKKMSRTEPIQIRWHHDVAGNQLGLEFWPSMGSFSDVFVAYKEVPELANPSPSLMAWSAPAVGPRNNPNFDLRNSNGVRPGRRDGFRAFLANVAVAYGQSASAIVPRCVSPGTTVLVGGTDASGNTMFLETKIPD